MIDEKVKTETHSNARHNMTTAQIQTAVKETKAKVASAEQQLIHQKSVLEGLTLALKERGAK